LSVEIGQKFPEFQLPDQDRKPRSLAEFLGKKIIVAFFPGAFTAACTKEMCALRDSLTNLSSLGGQVVGISVNDPWSNKAFADTHRLQFPLLSDHTRDTIRKLNIYHSDFGGVKGYTAAKRSIFILDSTGTVRYKWISEQPGKEPDYDEIKRQLAAM